MAAGPDPGWAIIATISFFLKTIKIMYGKRMERDPARAQKEPKKGAKNARKKARRSIKYFLSTQQCYLDESVLRKGESWNKTSMKKRAESKLPYLRLSRIEK
jgi:hypothetical protein